MQHIFFSEQSESVQKQPVMVSEQSESVQKQPVMVSERSESVQKQPAVAFTAVEGVQKQPAMISSMEEMRKCNIFAANATLFGSAVSSFEKGAASDGAKQ